jgi:hypothetical protein
MKVRSKVILTVILVINQVSIGMDQPNNGGGIVAQVQYYAGEFSQDLMVDREEQRNVSGITIYLETLKWYFSVKKRARTLCDLIGDTPWNIVEVVFQRNSSFRQLISEVFLDGRQAQSNERWCQIIPSFCRDLENGPIINQRPIYSIYCINGNAFRVSYMIDGLVTQMTQEMQQLQPQQT